MKKEKVKKQFKCPVCNVTKDEDCFSNKKQGNICKECFYENRIYGGIWLTKDYLNHIDDEDFKKLRKKDNLNYEVKYG